MEKNILKYLWVFDFSFSISVSAQVIGGSSQNAVNTPRDNVFDEIHVEFKKPVPYPPLRQADVIYKKRIWQVIDFREKMNQPFYYPIKAHIGWKSFIATILDALKAGELTAYDDRIDDEFTVPLTWDDINYRLNGSMVLKDSTDPAFFASAGTIGGSNQNLWSTSMHFTSFKPYTNRKNLNSSR